MTQGVATAILVGTVRTTTRPAHPHGCLGVPSALTTSDSGQEVRDLLVAWRNNGYSCIRERFQRAVDHGDLPTQTDPGYWPATSPPSPTASPYKPRAASAATNSRS
ncbi:hypothetical protein SALBM311S_09979 [Streptomyces alboniger]